MGKVTESVYRTICRAIVFRQLDNERVCYNNGSLGIVRGDDMFIYAFLRQRTAGTRNPRSGMIAAAPDGRSKRCASALLIPVTTR